MSERQIIWKSTTGSPIFGSVVVDKVNETLIYGAVSGKLECLKVCSQQQVWSFQCKKALFNTPLLLSTNVVPEYQRWGLGLVLLQRLVPDIKAWGIQEAEFSWVLESNKLSRGTLERGGTKLDKTYRIYDFDPS